jgi:fatty-acyl-CoA synthase
MERWQPRTCAESLAAAASRWPEGRAIVIEGRAWTFRQLWADVRRTAANLKRLGLRRGDHLAICMGNSYEWVTVFLATGTLGAVTVPVNTRFKADEFAYCLRQADIRMLAISDRFLKIDFIAMLRQIAPGIDAELPDPALPLLRSIVVFGDDVPAGCLSARQLDAPAEAEVDERTEGVSASDVLLIQYTSGTTAFPKGAMLTHGGMLRDAYEFGRRLDIRAGDRYFSGRPLFHVSGTTLSLLASLEAGACYLTTASFDIEQVLNILDSERCTHTSANDTMFLMMMNHPAFSKDRIHLRAAMAAATPTVMQQIYDATGIEGLCSAYGLSEGSGNCAIAPVSDRQDKRFAGYALPLPGVEIRIVAPGGNRDLLPGEVGEILLRGWNLMKGYYNMPEQTAAAIDRDGWLHTGDFGVRDEDGRLCFIGRLKDCFRVGGENVAPADVEDVLQRHPSIREAQVVGVPDPRLGEVAAAYVILNDGASASAEEIIAWSRERCANFKVPRYVRMVSSFDGIGMTASSKVQKGKLRDYVIKDLGLEGVTMTGRDAS